MEGDQNQTNNGVMGNNPPAGSNPNPAPAPTPAVVPVSQPENVEIKPEVVIEQTPTPTPTPTPAPQVSPVVNSTPPIIPVGNAVVAEKIAAHAISGDEVPTPTELNRKPFVIATIVIIGLLLAWFWYIFGQDRQTVWPGNQDNITVTVDDSQEQGQVNIVDSSDQDITTTTSNGQYGVPPVSGETVRITAFYSNSSRGSNNNCGAVFPLQRDVEKKYGSDIVNTIRGLLTPLADADRQAGWSSNVPNGAYLKSVVVKNGVAEVNFTSALDNVAGSCAVTALRAQIEQTVKQYAYVTSVLICVNGNCNQNEVLQP